MLIFIVVLIVSAIFLFGKINNIKYQTKTNKLQFENIGELATQVGYYTNVSSIANTRDLWGWEIPFTQSKYIFSYDGILKAGIDFADIKWSVDDANKKIHIKIPEIKILSNEIDDNSLMVYDETKNIFTPLTLEIINQSRIELKKKAIDTAISNGIIENALINAETLIKSFIAGSFDIKVYEIIFD